ncbi:MAG: hypothetical protein KDD45_14710, partial [Bdellovibrionales bacterium]|nr:hypothetical protein [Bdellovibrionales bacterium]
ASSSLCVAVGRWFQFMGLIKDSEIYDFSRKLENLFHGESSGVDIAVVLNEKPLLFARPQSIQFIDNFFKANLYLSYCGQRGVTKDCVEKVKSLFITHPELAQKLDQEMLETTQLLKQAFTQKDVEPKDRQEAILKGFNKGYEVFKSWGLTIGCLDEHINKLMNMGALACKPTGSGGGGFVLSYWPEGMPQLNSGIQFISVF